MPLPSVPGPSNEVAGVWPALIAVGAPVPDEPNTHRVNLPKLPCTLRGVFLRTGAAVAPDARTMSRTRRDSGKGFGRTVLIPVSDLVCHGFIRRRIRRKPDPLR